GRAARPARDGEDLPRDAEPQPVHLPRPARSHQDRHQEGRGADVRSQGRGRPGGQRARQDAPLRQACRPHAGLEEGLREPRQGPVDRLRGPRARLIGNTHMALIKYKPTSPGTRAVVKVDRSHLHKGGPYLPLTSTQAKTGARNNSGRITTRHHGGGSRQKYRVIDFKRDKDGITAVVERLEYDPTAPATSRCSGTPTASAATFSRR